jgi:hypothetical protein
MSIGKVDPNLPYESVGMINARRWSDTATVVLAGVIWAALGWTWAVFYIAVALTIRLEAKRVREALWPTCYHVGRLIMDEHGFEFDGEPHIHRKHP